MKSFRYLFFVLLLGFSLVSASPVKAASFDIASFISIYNKILTLLSAHSSSQLGQVASSISNGLSGYWMLDEGNGTTAADSSGNGNSGSLFGNPQWIAGKRGSGALNFNGSNYVNISATTNLSFSRNMSVSAWVRPDSTDVGTNHTFVEKLGEYGLLTRSGLFAFNASNSTLYATSAYTSGQWYQVVGTVDSNGTISLYINGTKQTGGINGASTGITIPSSSSALTLGKNFSGDVDDVRVYNRALSASEISSLYSGDSSIQNTTPITDTTTSTNTDTNNTPSTPAPSSYSLNVAISGIGTITSSPAGISCGATCSASFTSGSTVTLTAAASSGYVFNGWAGSCSGSQSTCTVSMNAAASVSASFISVVSGSRTWYVDSAASGSVHDGTSWTNAWTNLDQVTGIGPGDTVYISGGSTSKTYYINNWWVVGAGSDMSHRVTYKVGQEAGHNGVVILDGSHKAPPAEGHAIILNKNYVVISGEYNGEQHLKLQNYWGNGILNLPNLRGIKIEYIDLGDRNISLTESFTQFEISHVHVKAKPGSDHAINISGATGSTWGTNSLHDSLIEVGSTQNSTTGLGDDAIKWGAAIDIYNNTIRSFYTADPGHQHQDGIQAAGRYMRIYNNYFENLGNSAIFVDFFLAGELRDIWIYNNVFTQTKPALIGTVARPIETTCEEACPVIDNIKIFNNTIVDFSMTAINMQVRPTGTIPAISNVEIKNNLIVDTGSGGAAIDAFSSLIGQNSNFTAQKVTGVTVSNNLVEAGYQGKSGVFPPQTNGVTWQKGDEQFVWYVPFSSGNDFHLRSTDTNARGGGLNLSSYTTTDKDGLARSSSGTWDIGAYGFAQSASCSGPSAFFTASPNSGYDPLTVTLNASGSSACSGSLTYSWNFGDNSPLGSGSNVSHTFRSGTFTVSLTVKNTTGQTSTISRQITILPAAVPNMVLGVNFDNSIIDWSGKNSTTAWSGTPCYTTGVINQAGCFAGYNVVQVSNNPLVEGMSQFTFAGWAQKSTATGSGGMGGKFTVYNLFIGSQGLSASISTTNGGATLTFPTSANADTSWHHYAVTYDGTVASLYLDGVKVSQQALTGAVLTNPQQYFYIGAQPFGTFFKGSLDDVRVYDKALSETEMAALFKNRSASSDTTVPVTPTIPDPVQTADVTAPSVSITQPARNATISGTVSLSAAASDDVALATVQFKLDGSDLGSALSIAPYSGNWNTLGVSNGAHTLTAIVKDTSGNSATSVAVPIFVQNTPVVSVTPSPTPSPTTITPPQLPTPPVVEGGGAPSIPPAPTVPTQPSLPSVGFFTPTVSQPAVPSVAQKVAGSSVIFTRYLTIGSRGTDVQLLQQTLNNLGFTVAVSGSGSKGNETTYYGPATTKALQKFQCSHLNICSGSPSTNGYGNFGPTTRATLNRLLGGTLPTPPSLPQVPAITTSYHFTRPLTIGSRGADVLELQKYLNNHGFTIATTGAGSPGNETTYFGPATRSAVIRFQEANRTAILTPFNLTRGTGYVGKGTIKVLNEATAPTSTNTEANRLIEYIRGLISGKK